ncbi:MAG: sugar ABC transporter ATP-binding protein [Synergistetes bacterium]|nr:sugar ABC transporter ATP-binding protein [Synergistota bacterium]
MSSVLEGGGTESPATLPNCLLFLKDIHKRYPGVHALRGVSFSVCAGEVHALVGENGAGKSTLVKVLEGAVQPDAGEIWAEGKKVSWRGPGDAIEAGISVIHQELSLAPHLTVAQNIFLGREPRKGFFLDRKRMSEESRKIFSELGVDLDVDAEVSRLTVGEQQLVEIARALSRNARIIAMDEPTSSLSAREVGSLFRVIRDLKRKGVGIIYISHRLEEIFEIADRVSVLRDGELVGSGRLEDFTQEEIVSLMVGREIRAFFPRTGAPLPEVVLEVRNLTKRGIFRNISFSLRRGEILGIAGLVGSGRSEVAMSIFGVCPPDEGEIIFEGRPVKIDSPRDAIMRGIFLVPEDRKVQGLFLNMSLKHNLTIVELLRNFKGLSLVNERNRENRAREFVEELSIKCSGLDIEVRSLSGGNQQKVVIAKGLSVSPKVLILDEPTRGIDVGAKAEVHQLMDDLTRRGVAILMISSELPEVMGMSDRVLVMRSGEIVASLRGSEISGERIMMAAAGGSE